MTISALEAQRSASFRSLQVINEVKCVIRELVENAIDAGANNIVVKMVDNGATTIQVTDNGKGIHESNFEQLALPNTTSKIQTFEDIFSSLTSHGFRGEALNSIANVGTLEMETRMADDDMGWSLKFSPDGTLKEKTRRAMPTGTTVICHNLFEPYPVRRNMMLKTIKNNVSASVSMVQQYALIHPDIRFALTNVTSVNHQIRSLFTSPGTCKTIREVSENIFGHSFIKNVVDIDIRSEGWSIEGVISTPQTGRLSNDIQILFVNNRPVDEMKKIKRCLKEVHKQFSSKYNVAYVLNLTIDHNKVDINLAPDKRRLFLLQEEMIMQQLKERIVELYLMIMARVTLNSDPLQQKQMQFADSCTTLGKHNSEQQEPQTTRSSDTPKTDNGDTSCRTDSMCSSTVRTQLEPASTDNTPVMELQRTQSDESDMGSQDPDKADIFLASCISKVHVGSQDGIPRVTSHGNRASIAQGTNMNLSPSEEQNNSQSHNETTTQSSLDTPDKMIAGGGVDLNSLFRDVNRDLTVTMRIKEPLFRTEANMMYEANEAKNQDTYISAYSGTTAHHESSLGPQYMRDSDTTELHGERRQWTLGEYVAYKRGRDTLSDHDLFKNVETQHEREVATPNLQQMEDRLTSPSSGVSPQSASMEQYYSADSKDQSMDMDTNSSKSNSQPSANNADICNDDVLTVDMDRLYDDNLCTVISERSVDSNYYSTRIPTLTDSGIMDPKVFLKMKICGQFNNGFIIAKLEGTEIDTEEIKYSMYLIDPHAADEKTKFELYNDIVKIVKQPLVCPRKIDLSPFHQQVVEANLDIIKENGFDVHLVHKTEDDRENNAAMLEPGVYLKSLPQLVGHILGEEDFISFVHDLAKNGITAQTALNHTESYKVLWGGKAILPRPRRIWNILASRACKKAVKLGEPLSMKQMESIKDGLATLIHPWNCPHGRPTMKCLITTEQLKNIIK